MKKRITALILSAMLLSMVSPAAAGAESDVYKQTEMQFTGINTTRAENTLIIYRGKPSTGTNTWGYEVVCDKEGTVISVGGNNNDIPEGGFVLSAIGTYKQPLINAAEVGMKVTLFESEKKFYIGYSPSGIKRKYELMISEISRVYNKFTHNFYDFDSETVSDNIDEMDKLGRLAAEAADNGDEENFRKYDSDFTALAEATHPLLTPHHNVEARTIWLRIQTNKSDRVVQNTVKAINDLGFNSVCIEAMFDNSMIVPMPEDSLFVQNPAFGGKDMLKLYIDEFHKYGIEVHLWMSCYRVGYEGSGNTKLSVGVKKPEWRCVSANGKDTVSNEYGDAYFLNPALPEVKETLLEMYRYFLENYDIDGFQLDYVRYPEVTGLVYGYDDYTVSEFLKKYPAYSAAPKNSGQNGWNSWCEFRAAYVTDLVKSVKEMISEIRPDVWFSADVAPASLSSLPGTTCQDTRTWIKEGLVDIIYPMAYGTTDAVEKWTKQTLDLCGNSVYAVMGLRDNGVEDYFDQINKCRELYAAGTAFFSYSQYTTGKYKGNIEKTAFAKPAVNPTSSAKETVLAAMDEYAAVLEKYAAHCKELVFYSCEPETGLKETVLAGRDELKESTLSQKTEIIETLCNKVTDHAK
ncbi:MAG: family 10 glycosylhydrolase, partial [Clostridia bacterium]|nr:family 10 glycosylhydrolase [Clostridia bacterium]